MKLWFIARYWLPLFFVISVFSLLIYLTVQQNFRMNANDPQIQMAEDIASSLNAGNAITSLVSSSKVNISTSLAPFVIVYDQKGKAMFSSGLLENKIPVLPGGVLQAVSVLGEDRLTWQPEVGVRIASVIVPYAKGYVLAGRSLREVEKREDALGIYVFGAWLISSIGTLFIVSILSQVSLLIKKK